MSHVIKVNGVVWTVLNTRNWTIARGKTKARLVWRASNAGSIIFRDVSSGRFKSRNFTA